MRTLKERCFLGFQYFIFWLVYFALARGIFLGFYYHKTAELDWNTILGTFGYGLKLDISFTGYLCLIPFLLLTLSVFLPQKFLKLTLKGYTFLVLVVINLFMLIDVILYKSWGVRIDDTLLNYINTPKIMLASVSIELLIGGILIWLGLSIALYVIFNRVFSKNLNTIQKGKLWEIPLFLVLFGSLILPIRGGLQTIPINQSNVYFSNKMFANHAAVNFIWNFANALTHKTEKTNPYQHFSTAIANKITSNTQTPLLIGNDSILTTKKPNVIVLIWESLSAKAVGVLDGTPGVTENLNSLAEEGILFTNFYGNGDRTDKGLPAILSGYYPQPTHSIIKTPNKASSLPMLTKEMNSLGYTTSFYYGGDTNFGNLNAYLRSGEIDRIVDGSFFNKEDWNSKWGAHDHILLEHLSKDLSSTELKQPFFSIALTLTSHEPYEFPDTYKFGKDTEENLYKSAQAYTDKAIGNFIKAAKQQPWWNNTLVVIMADHGHPLPKHSGYFNAPKKFQIPMLWLGGALKQKGISIDNYTSQIDFPYTLMRLLDGNATAFSFSKHLFNSSESQYVHYIFNKGFGTLNKNGVYIYDYVSNKPVITEGNYQPLDSLGKAISQGAYQDFLDR